VLFQRGTCTSAGNVKAERTVPECWPHEASLGDGWAYQYATIYAQWGNRAKALEWLDTALRLRDSGAAQKNVVNRAQGVGDCTAYCRRTSVYARATSCIIPECSRTRAMDARW
jgi:hypothetical protein